MGRKVSQGLAHGQRQRKSPNGRDADWPQLSKGEKYLLTDR